MPDETQVQTPVTPKPDDDRVAAMAAKTAELLAEAKAAKERLRQYADVFGVDPGKQTPEQIAQSRAAEQRERERRATAVERAVTRSLVTGGYKVPEPVSDLLLSGAIQSQAIKVDESGTVQGAREYLDGILTALRSDAPAAPRPESPQVPRQKLPGADDVDEKFANVRSFEDLMALGPGSMSTFFEKHRDRYDALYAARATSMKQSAGRLKFAPATPTVEISKFEVPK